jgi:hypothetical protein
MVPGEYLHSAFTAAAAAIAAAAVPDAEDNPWSASLGQGQHVNVKSVFLRGFSVWELSLLRLDYSPACPV